MKKNKIAIILSTILTLLIIAIVFLLISINNKKQFVKPVFDKNAVDIPEKLDYQKNEIKVAEGYVIYIEPTPKKENTKLKINLVSVMDNNIWVKVRILNDNKEVIGETGLIKPGQYLENVILTQKVETSDRITYKIMGYERDKYISAGSISLNTRIGE